MVRAKFKVTLKSETLDGFNIELAPVVAGINPENSKFFKYTPSGKIQMAILNSDAADQLKVSKEYYVDFTEVPVSTKEGPATT